MPENATELNPTNFVTINTTGPKGRRIFYLQATDDAGLVTLIIEKQQAQALANAIDELLGDLMENAAVNQPSTAHSDMSLRKPIDPLFRVANLGIGFDMEQNRVILVAQELAFDTSEMPVNAPHTVKLWIPLEQAAALSAHIPSVVSQGRPDPGANGHMVYYWT